MFPGSKIAPSFSLSRTSGSYKISESLAPYFKKTIVEDLVKLDLPFSMLSIVLSTNAESDRNLFINAPVVTKNKASHGKPTIIGLRAVKEAVHIS